MLRTFKTTIQKNLPKSQKFARRISVSEFRYSQDIPLQFRVISISQYFGRKSNEQQAKGNKQQAKNNEQGAKSKEQWGENNEQRTKSNEQQSKNNKQRAKGNNQRENGDEQ